jgi:hypothetical protein
MPKGAQGGSILLRRFSVKWVSFKSALTYSSAYGNDHHSTLPFFGIATVDANLWAVGIDGIYRIAHDGVAKVSTLPDFQQIGNVSVSFAVPSVVLVRTDVNKRRSVSGSAPMIVAR